MVSSKDTKKEHTRKHVHICNPTLGATKKRYVNFNPSRYAQQDASQETIKYWRKKDLKWKQNLKLKNKKRK